MKTVALLGTGLMGGSIGLALHARGVNLKVRAYARRQDTLDALLEHNIADEVFSSPSEAAEGADLIIACVPVCAIPQLIHAARPGIKAGAVVTDVGSTKSWLAGECQKILQGSGAVFVGSHPMCGSEKTGIEAASGTLYQGAVCVVCADKTSRSEVWKVAQFWTRLGCRVVEMPAAEHDRIAAKTSHVPHVVASAVVLSTFENTDKLRALIGPGFLDSTRVASGSPELWRDIVGTNPQPVADGLRAVSDRLKAFAAAIETLDLNRVEALLSGAAEAREHLCQPLALSSQVVSVIAIDGPSASGKSTVARKVAERLHYLYVDSGSFYRGVTWKVLQEGVDPQDEKKVIEVLRASTWSFPTKEDRVGFVIDGMDPGEEIRGQAVRDNVSYVARIPEVREFVNDRIRATQFLGPLVVEGRDIGSVVFPESPFKFYLDADPVERARRRNKELMATEADTSIEAVQENLQKRDQIDSSRKTAPLQIAEGAKVMDTTHMTLDEVVDVVVKTVR
jgi:cytidylate kinase